MRFINVGSFLYAMFLVSSVTAQVTQTFTFSANDLRVNAKTFGDSKYTEIEMSGLIRSGNEGEPSLPTKNIQYIIPPEQEIDDIDISMGNEQEIAISNPIVPNPKYLRNKNGEELNSIYLKNDRIYSSKQVWPIKNVKVEKQGYFDGDKHIVTIQICPFKYQPSVGKLTFTGNIKITIKFKMMSSLEKYCQPSIRPQNRQLLYDIILKSTVQNSQDIQKYTPIRKNVVSGLSKATSNRPPFYEYVVITSPDLKASFNDLITWKRQKGLDAGVVSTDMIYSYYTSGDLTSGINDDAGRIRQYLKEAWQSGKTIWVLLGGHGSNVPVRYGTGDNNTYAFDGNGEGSSGPGKVPTDLYFASLTDSWNKDGDSFYGEPEDAIDHSPEVFVGRVLCKNATDVANWTQILLKYEKQPGGTNGGSYLKTVFQCQADQYQNYQSAQKMRDFLQGYSFTTNYLEESPAPDVENVYAPTPATVVTEMDKNYGMIFLYLHGGDGNVATMTRTMRIENGYQVTGDPYFNGDPRYNILSEIGQFENQASLRLVNTDYPKVLFLTTCANSNFMNTGNAPVFSSAFMGREKGGPAVFGNTMYGYFDKTFELTKLIVYYIFNAAVYTMDQLPNPSIPGGVSDGVFITAGPKSIGQKMSTTYTANFTDADFSGSTAQMWNWKIVLFHNNGEYILNSQDNLQSQNQSTWIITTGTIPQGYNWIKNTNGAIAGKVVVNTIDSDSIPHQIALALNVYEGNVPGTGMAKAGNRALQIHSSQAGVAEFVGKNNYTAGYNHYLNLSHNLLGCPEMSIWTDVPTTFDNVMVSLNGSVPASLHVNTNVDGATIAVTSVQDGSGSYFGVARRVKEYTFNNITDADFPVLITITKENYLPYQITQSKLVSAPPPGASTIIMTPSTIPFTVSGSTVNRSNSFDVQGSDGADVVYNLVLKKASILDFTMCNTNTKFDTKLEIFQSNRTSTGFYNDDDFSCSSNYMSSGLHNVSLAAGDYYIVVDGYNGAVGNYQLTVSYAPSGSQNIVSLPFSHRGTTVGLSNKWDVQNGDGADADYNISFAVPACIKASTCNSYTNFNTMLEFFNADRTRANVYNNNYTCSSGGTKATINNGRLPQGQYFLVVDGYDGATGNYDLQIDYAYDYSISSLPYNATGSTSGKKNDWDVMYSDGEDVAYKLDLTSPIMLDITLCKSGTNYDTKLEIFNENGVSTGLYNDDDYTCSANGMYSAIYRAALAPGRYFIVVDGYNGAVGNYNLSVSVSNGLAKEFVPINGLSKIIAKNAFDIEAEKADKKIKNIPTDMQSNNIVYELDKMLNDGKPVIPSESMRYHNNTNKALAMPVEVSMNVKIASQKQIQFALPAEGQVDISMYSLNGAKVKTIVNGMWPAGFHSVKLNEKLDRLGKQMYVCCMKANGKIIVKNIPIFK
jgi:hypothetical protein